MASNMSLGGHAGYKCCGEPLVAVAAQKQLTFSLPCHWSCNCGLWLAFSLLSSSGWGDRAVTELCMKTH